MSRTFLFSEPEPVDSVQIRHVLKGITQFSSLQRDSSLKVQSFPSVLLVLSFVIAFCTLSQNSAR